MLDRLRAWLRGSGDGIAPVAIDRQRVEEACGVAEGFVRANWEDLGAYVQGTFEAADQPGAWSAVSRRWLELAADHLGAPYRVEEGKRTVFLTAWERPGGMVKLGDEICADWDRMIKGIARPAWKGKAPIVMIDDQETYHDYIAPYYPEEGVFARSVGVFLNEEMPHVALFSCAATGTMSTLAHELTHGCLARLKLPRWIDEGFAQVAEGAAGARFNPELREVERFRRYWQKHGFEEFWEGESFSRPKSGEASYFLAQVLVRNLLAGYRKQIPALLQAVRRDDGGAAGVREVLGLELEDLVKGIAVEKQQVEDEWSGGREEWSDDEEDEDEEWRGR